MAGEYQPGRVLDHNGRPWQEAEELETGFPLPHVWTFASIMSSGWKTYYPEKYDEALRNDRQYGMYMRNDASVMGLLNERKLGTASLKWHIDIDNEKDPAQKAIKDGLTSAFKSTKYLQKLLMYLLETIWYGRYGAQVAYEKRVMSLPDVRNPDQRTKRLAYTLRHKPVNGDKIRFLWDGTPCVKVQSAHSAKIPQAELVRATDGWAVALRGSWRKNFIIHSHEVFDADFWAHEASDSIHGVGVRSFIHWMHWLRSEWLGNIADWCARTGLGVRVWYFQGGNPTSRREVEEAAKKQSDRTNLLVPRYPTASGRPVESVEFVDTAGTGAELLLKLQKHIDEIIERYMIGQTLSSSTEGNGLGGTGVADMHAATKNKIIAFDANNLQETLSEDVIRPMAIWMYPDVPEVRDIPLGLVFEVDSSDPDKKLTAVEKAARLGVTFRMNDVRGVTGFEAPQQGDETIGGAPQPQPGAGPPGAPGQPPGGEDGDLQPPAEGEDQPDDQNLDAMAAQLFGPGGGGEGQQPQRNGRHGEPERFAADWDETKHKRGQPGNPGQFGSGGGSKKPHPREYGEAAAGHFNRQIDRVHRTLRAGGDHAQAKIETAAHADTFLRRARTSLAHAWKQAEQQAIETHGDTPALRSLLAKRKSHVVDELKLLEEFAQERVAQPFGEQRRKERDDARGTVSAFIRRLHAKIDAVPDEVAQHLEVHGRNHQFQEAAALAQRLTERGRSEEDAPHIERMGHPDRWATVRQNPHTGAWEVHTKAHHGQHFSPIKGGGMQLTDTLTGKPAKPKASKDKVVKSEAFKSWFGDWERNPAEASKVVKESGEPQETHQIPSKGSRVKRNGKPVAVYHGTPKGDFNAFDKSKDSGKNLYGPGFYFTDDPTVAHEYRVQRDGKLHFDDSALARIRQMVEERKDHRVSIVDREGGFELHRSVAAAQGLRAASQDVTPIGQVTDISNPYMLLNITGDRAKANELRREMLRLATPVDGSKRLEVYLNIRKPFDLDKDIDRDEASKIFGNKVVKSYLSEASRGSFISQSAPIPFEALYDYATSEYEVPKDQISKAIADAGYDGLTHIGGTIMGGGHEHRVWIAFEPTQIKATDNTGTFDPKNPDMRYRRDGDPSRYAKIDARTAVKVGDALGIDWDEVDREQFRQGLEVELEHGTRDPETDVTHDDLVATGKIAWAHLKESRDYYTKLKAVETYRREDEPVRYAGLFDTQEHPRDDAGKFVKKHVQDTRKAIASGHAAPKTADAPFPSAASGRPIKRFVELPTGQRIHPDELHRMRFDGDEAFLSDDEGLTVGRNTAKSFGGALARAKQHPGQTTIQSAHGYAVTLSGPEWAKVHAEHEKNPRTFSEWHDDVGHALKSQDAGGPAATLDEPGDFFAPRATQTGNLFDRPDSDEWGGNEKLDEIAARSLSRKELQDQGYRNLLKSSDLFDYGYSISHWIKPGELGAEIVEYIPRAEKGKSSSRPRLTASTYEDQVAIHKAIGAPVKSRGSDSAAYTTDLLDQAKYTVQTEKELAARQELSQHLKTVRDASIMGPQSASSKNREAELRQAVHDATKERFSELIEAAQQQKTTGNGYDRVQKLENGDYVTNSAGDLGVVQRMVDTASRSAWGGKDQFINEIRWLNQGRTALKIPDDIRPIGANAFETAAPAKPAAKSSAPTDSELAAAHIKGVLSSQDMQILTGSLNAAKEMQQEIRERLGKKHEEMGKFIQEVEEKGDDTLKEFINYDSWKKTHATLGRVLDHYDSEQPPAGQLFSRDGDPIRYEAKRSPKGGVSVRGKHYPGGEWIPGSEMAQASPAERAAVEGQGAPQAAGAAKPAPQGGAGQAAAPGQSSSAGQHAIPGGGQQAQPGAPGAPAALPRSQHDIFPGLAHTGDRAHAAAAGKPPTMTMSKDAAKAIMKTIPEEPNLPEGHGQYFNVDKADAIVDMGKIKNLRQRPEGVENANRFMNGARLGKLPKRDPLKVVKNEDGTFTVADGNSTFANAKRAGWSSLPVKFVDQAFLEAEQAKTLFKENERAREVIGSHKFFTDAERALPKEATGAFRDQESLFQAANATKPTFDHVMNMGAGVTKRLGATAAHVSTAEQAKAAIALPGTVVIVGGIKGAKRAAEKVAADYDGDWGKLHDSIRATVATDSLNDLPKAMQAIREELSARGWSIAKFPKNKFEKPTEAGYRDMNLTFVTDKGLTGEIQLNTKAMLRAKELAGHVLYERSRTIESKALTEKRDMTATEKAARDSFNERSKTLYETAWQVSLGLKTNDDLDAEIAGALKHAGQGH